MQKKEMIIGYLLGIIFFAVIRILFRNNKRGFVRWTLMRSILFQIGIMAIMAFLLGLIIPSMMLAILIAAFIWTYVLCFTSMFNLWFIRPRANTAVVLANTLHREESVLSDDGLSDAERDKKLTQLQKSTTMRVLFGPTFDGRLPWEEIVNNQTVNLLRSVTLEGPLECITSENVKCIVHWQGFLTVIPSEECIINLIRHNEEKIKLAFTRFCEAYIQSTVRTMTVDKLFHEIYYAESQRQTTKGHAELTNGFSLLFEGDDIITPKERGFGMQTNNLTVSQVVLDPAYQKTIQSISIAEQSVLIASKAREAIKAYKEAGVDPNIAANLNASDRGVKEPGNVQVYAGLDKLPPNTHLVVASLDKKT